jgi:hypothetical protein
MARQHGPGARKKQAISERMNNWYGHPQNEVKEAMIANFARRTPLGHREVREDKCGDLVFG